MNTFMSLTMSGVCEDEILQAMQVTSDVKDLTQVEDMFERYVKTDCAPIEFRAWWYEHQKSRPRKKTRFLSPLGRRSAKPAAESASSFAEPTVLTLAPELNQDAESQEEVVVLKKKLQETQELGLLFEEENKRMHDDLRTLVYEKVKSEVEQHNAEWTKKIRQNEKEKATLQARVDVLVNEKATLQTNVKMLVDERQVLADENDELRKAKSPLQKAVTSVTDAVSLALSAPEVESLKRQLEASAAEIVSLKDQHQKVFKQFQGAQGAKAAADQRHEAEMSKLRDTISAEQAVIAKDKVLQVEYESYRDMATDSISKSEAVIADLQKQLADAKQSKERMHAVAKTSQEKLEVTIKQSAMLDADRLAEKSAREAAEKKLAEVQANSTTSGARDLDTIAASFKNLYKLGFLTRADIAEKLVSQVLGDTSK